MANAQSTDAFLDKRFLVAAFLIGLGYTLIVVLITYAVSKEAAGVAAVALTAIATALFKQFEKLRFRQLRENEGVEITIERPLILVTLISSLVGAQAVAGIAAIALVSMTIPAAWILSMLAEYPTTTVLVIGLGLSAVTGATFMVSTFYSVKALRVVRYSTVTVGVLAVAAIQLLLPALLVLSNSSPFKLQISWVAFLIGASPWLIYLILALWGARLARPRLLIRPQEPGERSIELELEPI